MKRCRAAGGSRDEHGSTGDEPTPKVNHSYPHAAARSSYVYTTVVHSTFLDWNQAALCETAVSELRGLRNSYSTVSYCIRRSTGFTSVVLTFTLSLELSE